ncbi:hypothetical protein G3O06_16900 [Burkholderia sp. Ac-20345]|uniref:hypothetical protein n=1 Tax=Burkholderia sp. Ac-20345 TaxID=2703891 RepID=UPI00197B4DEF|nr:hypothetical protein [Burkholderia sp. Ac-20345]MBN3779216.1 hypothetical protein [Burkholderia sp. Ac-20345]
MTILSAVVRAAALAAVLYAANRHMERRNVVDISPAPRKVTTQRVAGIVTGLALLALYVYFERHVIAATFHIQ